jgi:hypothetical protein
LNVPSATRRFGFRIPLGSHSHAFPALDVAPPRFESSNSSHESQVPHGVWPPAQLERVPPRMRRASTILPRLSKRIALAPPIRWTSPATGMSAGSGASLLTT